MEEPDNVPGIPSKSMTSLYWSRLARPKELNWAPQKIFCGYLSVFVLVLSSELPEYTLWLFSTKVDI